MIRTPEWKLIRHFEPDGVDELYDLANDPGETKNLAYSTDHREIYKKLDSQLSIWMRSIHDPLAKDHE